MINRTVPEKIPCNMSSLYRLAYRGLFPKKAYFGEQLDIKSSIIVGASTYLQFQEEFWLLECDTIVCKDWRRKSVTLEEL